MTSTVHETGYLTHIPVRSYLEADILSKQSTWDILNYVKKTGAIGASANEISKILNLPPSVVYATLKELRRLEFISILPRERRTRDRNKRYVCEKATWGKYRVDSSFLNVIAYEGITKRVTEELQRPVLKLFSDLFDQFESRNKLRPFRPRFGSNEICSVCDRNHEATEFVYAILLAALDPFISESQEFRSLLVAKGYAK